MIFVMMGVSGSGKTTIGSLLAKKLNVAFADADDYHPAANKLKMAAGHPLTDADRHPWLQALNAVLAGWQKAGVGGVLACSALKASYRQDLSRGLPPGSVQFIFLTVPKEVIAGRMQGRKHEFMNPALLDSQIATLEQPREDEALEVTNDRTPDEVVAEIESRVSAGQRA